MMVKNILIVLLLIMRMEDGSAASLDDPNSQLGPLKLVPNRLGTQSGQLPFGVIVQQGFPDRGFLDRFHSTRLLRGTLLDLDPFHAGLYALRTAKVIDLLQIRKDIAIVLGGTERLRQLSKISHLSFDVPKSVDDLYIASDANNRFQQTVTSVEALLASLKRVTKKLRPNHDLRRKVLRQLVLDASFAGYIEHCFLDSEQRSRYVKTKLENSMPFDRVFADIINHAKVLAITVGDAPLYRHLYKHISQQTNLLPECDIKHVRGLLRSFSVKRRFRYQHSGFKNVYAYVDSEAFHAYYYKRLSRIFDEALLSWFYINDRVLKSISAPRHYDENPEVFLSLALDDSLWKRTAKHFKHMLDDVHLPLARAQALQIVMMDHAQQAFIIESLLTMGGVALVSTGIGAVIGAGVRLVLIRTSASMLSNAWKGATLVLDHSAVQTVGVAAGGAIIGGTGMGYLRAEKLALLSEEMFFSGYTSHAYDQLLETKEYAADQYWQLVGSLFLFAGAPVKIVQQLSAGISRFTRAGVPYVALSEPLKRAIKSQIRRVKWLKKRAMRRYRHGRGGPRKVTAAQLQSPVFVGKQIENGLRVLKTNYGYTQAQVVKLRDWLMNQRFLKLYVGNSDFRHKLHRYWISDFLIMTGGEIMIRKQDFKDEIPFYLTDIVVGLGIVAAIVARTYHISGAAANFTFLDVIVKGFKNKGLRGVAASTPAAFKVLWEPGKQMFVDAAIITGAFTALIELIMHVVEPGMDNMVTRFERTLLSSLVVAAFVGVTSNTRMQTLVFVENSMLRKGMSAKRIDRNMFGLALRNDILGSGLYTYLMSRWVQGKGRQRWEEKTYEHVKTVTLVPADDQLLIFRYGL